MSARGCKATTGLLRVQWRGKNSDRSGAYSGGREETRSKVAPFVMELEWPLTVGIHKGPLDNENRTLVLGRSCH